MTTPNLTPTPSAADERDPVTDLTATYSPDDNKLRLYALHRLPPALGVRVREAGFRYAPKKRLFVAPMWTPEREDLLIELCGDIDDEDKSLVERAQERTERFENYSEHRARDAEKAHAAVAAIVDHIPFGQPILVGHHSERRARKDDERIQSGMSKAVQMWKTSDCWTHRAQAAIRHARYKERPDVRRRRIKTLEADRREQERRIAEAEHFLAQWNREGLTKERALTITQFDHVHESFPLVEYPRTPPASQYEGPMSLWSALKEGVTSETQAREVATAVHHRTIARAQRWLVHDQNRLEYERVLLAQDGGTAADRTRAEQGGACRCWASPQKGWSYIQKVNRVSVTLLENYGNGGPNRTLTVPFDKLTELMSRAEVEGHKAAGRLHETTDQCGFYLRHTPTPQKPAAAA